MKIKILVLSIFVLFTAGLVTAQETKPSFLNKANQHSISAEFAAISYSYAHKFKPNATFGARVQVGLGVRYLITNPSFYESSQSVGGPVWTKVGDGLGSEFSVDIITLQLFYRSTISNQFYYDIGPYIALGLGVCCYEEGVTDLINAGLEGSVYYQIWKIHLGSRIMAGFHYMTVPNTDYFGFDVIPIVVGFNF